MTSHCITVNFYCVTIMVAAIVRHSYAWNIKPTAVCPHKYKKFEIITGYAYTLSADSLSAKSGSLELSECLDQCRSNEQCQAINFETGLCVLLNSSAIEKPDALKESQFPVFTIYAQKVCISDYGKCSQAWTYERVLNFELRGEPKRVTKSPSSERCIEQCIREDEFTCRSVNYDKQLKSCELFDIDRHTGSGFHLNDLYFGLMTSDTKDYLETNCYLGGNRLCEFKKLPTLVLKTVDAIYEHVDSVKECRKKCLDAPFRCHSFDLGDGNSKVCRISHLDRASLTHVQEPYSEVPGATTYEMDLCFNVSLVCGKKEMVAKFSSSKAFTGKLYAASRPNSCSEVVRNSHEFELSMPYKDFECGVHETSLGRFSSNIVIQKHNLIVTSTDLDLTLNCEYDLKNRVVTNQIQLQSVGDGIGEIVSDETNLGFEVIELSPSGGIPSSPGSQDTDGPRPVNRPTPDDQASIPVREKPEKEKPTHEATFNTPVVTMRITDRDGQPVRAAEVGDPLSLRFEITDPNSPYEIFVKDIIADDGVDTSELTLIDDEGCPTDIAIMGPVRQVHGNGRHIEAPFDAFKFPTSGIVQFRALIIPCLEACEPVSCNSFGFDGSKRLVDSFGRRRRSLIEVNANLTSGSERNEYIAVETIQIFDKFPLGHAASLKRDPQCFNVAAWMTTCGAILFVQVVLMVMWALMWYRKRNSNSDTYISESSIIGLTKPQILQFTKPASSKEMSDSSSSTLTRFSSRFR